MRNIILIIFLVVFSLITAAWTVQAEQNPQEQLKQLIADLQKNPGDYALREKIIKHVQTMVPLPQVPQEAKRPFVKGVTFQKEATSVSDYELAINAYKEALLLAPWWPDAIYNMALAQEGAGYFDGAIQNIRLYLITGPKDAEEAQNRMYALEAKKEKTAKDALKESQERERKSEELIQGLSGTWIITKDYQSRQNPDYSPDAFSNEYYRMGLTGQNTFSLSWYKITDGPFSERQPGFSVIYTGTVTGMRISGTLSSRDDFTSWGCGMMDFSGTFEGTISPDGKKIQMTISRTKIDNPNACTKKNVAETIEFIKE